jgi:hypothetical protein
MLLINQEHAMKLSVVAKSSRRERAWWIVASNRELSSNHTYFAWYKSLTEPTQHDDELRDLAFSEQIRLRWWAAYMLRVPREINVLFYFCVYETYVGDCGLVAKEISLLRAARASDVSRHLFEWSECRVYSSRLSGWAARHSHHCLSIYYII